MSMERHAAPHLRRDSPYDCNDMILMAALIAIGGGGVTLLARRQKSLDQVKVAGAQLCPRQWCG